MTENKRFWVENERILNTYVLRIFKEDEIIFEINNWNSLNETNKVECEEIANELNKLSDENEKLKSDIKYFETTYEIEERGLDIVPEMCTITSSTPSRTELFKENEQLKQEYQKLKHRHSLLHDECLDIECERDSLKKDVNSLEEENEQLKIENKELKEDLEHCANQFTNDGKNVLLSLR